MTTPSWNGSFLSVVYRLGVPAAIALFLVYAGTQLLSSMMRQQADALTRQAVQITETFELLKAHVQEQQFYLHAICLNTAIDTKDRDRCIPKAK